MDYKVAVIVPTLNEENFISGVIESMIAQTFPFTDMDFMVIDGGSSDKTREIVKGYSNRYHNIRLFNNPKRIQSAAFNIGVSNSTAFYIIRLDAHAIYDKNYIAICYELLTEHPEYGNVGGVCSILPQHSRIQAETNAIVNKVRFGIGGASFRIGVKEGRAVDTVPFGAFPRSVINEIGGMREDLARGEDNEFNSRIRQANYTVYLDPRIISSYYARPTLAASCRQMYNNGLSIGKLFHIDRSSIGLRHFAPMGLVIGVLLGILLVLFNYKLWIFLALIVGIYFIGCICATISACLKYGFKYFFHLPVFFLSIHLSYGVGTIIGIFKK